jgi:hypothetical protein
LFERYGTTREKTFMFPLISDLKLFAPVNIDAMKRNTRRVLDRWMSESDPVSGFRAALASCGLIPHRRERCVAAAVSSQGSSMAFDENEVFSI